MPAEAKLLNRHRVPTPSPETQEMQAAKGTGTRWHALRDGVTICTSRDLLPETAWSATPVAERCRLCVRSLNAAD